MVSHKQSRRWSRIGVLGRIKYIVQSDTGDTRQELIKREHDKDIEDAIRSITVEARPLTPEEKKILSDNLFDLL